MAGLVDSLRASTASPLSLVAVVGGEVVGHALFTRSLLDAPQRLVDVQVLSPLGVLPEFHRRGVGSALVRRGLEMLAERGAPLVFLEGERPVTPLGADTTKPRKGPATLTPCDLRPGPSDWL